MARPKASSPSKRATKSKAIKKVKDKNAPKKPTTAFFYYVKHRRDQKADQGMKVSEFTKECGALWRELGADEKGKFEKLAVGDRERYQKAMAIYNPGSVPDPNEPVKPKKASTPFILFANAKRPELITDGFSPRDVLSEAGRLWKEMDDDDKEEFTSASADDKKRYEKAMVKYNEEMKGMKKNGAAAAVPVKKPVAKKVESEDDDDDDDEEDDDDMDSDDE